MTMLLAGYVWHDQECVMLIVDPITKRYCDPVYNSMVNMMAMVVTDVLCFLQNKIQYVPGSKLAS